jgi:hypothetical protein
MLRSFGNVDPHRGDPNITSNRRSVRLSGGLRRGTCSGSPLSLITAYVVVDRRGAYVR